LTEKIKEAFYEFWESVLQNSPQILIGIGTLLIFILIGIGLRSLVKRRLDRRIEDQLLVNFVGRVIFLLFLIIGIVIFLNQIGLGRAASGLLAGAGVSALILGFAFKDIGENFLAGFFLAFSRPFGIGDVIEIEGLKGTVKALSFRNTHIRTFDGKDIFLPNAMLIKNPLINFTRDGLLRHNFLVGIDYGDDIAEVTRLILETLKEIKSIEHEDNLAPFLQIDEFGTSTINIRIFYWVNSYEYKMNFADIRTEVMNSVVKSLMEKGFTLPADIVELKIYQEGQPIPLMMKQGE